VGVHEDRVRVPLVEERARKGRRLREPLAGRLGLTASRRIVRGCDCCAQEPYALSERGALFTLARH
jgi:hypothetical protein